MAAADLLSTGKHADCIIHCRDLTFRLHKAILITKSTYFEKMFDGPFEEAHTANATIDEEPAMFARVIEFIYLNACSETALTNAQRPCHDQFGGIKDVYEERHPIFLHIDMFHFADIFTIVGLKQEALKEFARHWFTAFQPNSHPNQPFRCPESLIIKAPSLPTCL